MIPRTIASARKRNADGRGIIPGERHHEAGEERRRDLAWPGSAQRMLESLDVLEAEPSIGAQSFARPVPVNESLELARLGVTTGDSARGCKRSCLYRAEQLLRDPAAGLKKGPTSRVGSPVPSP
jgi:hypothetical protein